MASSFLEEKRDEIQTRMAEIKPLVEEYNLLQGAFLALGGDPHEIGAPRPSGRPRSKAKPAAN